MSSMLNPVPGEEIRAVLGIEQAAAGGANCDDCDPEHTYQPGVCLAAIVANAEDDARAEAIEAQSKDGHRLIIRSDETKGRKRIIRFDCALISCDLEGVIEHGTPGAAEALFAIIAHRHSTGGEA